VTEFSKTFPVFYKWPDPTDVQVVLPGTVDKQILQDEESLHDQPLNTEIPYFSTFNDHHCAAGTQRLFIKGASKDSNILERFMPVTTAFEMDGVQLYDYCQRNDLLRNPEISMQYLN
jgi:hypothetical protein